MRIVVDSPATPAFAMSTLPAPVVRFEPALAPIATFETPVVFAASACWPIATFSSPLVLA